MQPQRNSSNPVLLQSHPAQSYLYGHSEGDKGIHQPNSKGHSHSNLVYVHYLLTCSFTKALVSITISVTKTSLLRASECKCITTFPVDLVKSSATKTLSRSSRIKCTIHYLYEASEPLLAVDLVLEDSEHVERNELLFTLA